MGIGRAFGGGGGGGSHTINMRMMVTGVGATTGSLNVIQKKLGAVNKATMRWTGSIISAGMAFLFQGMAIKRFFGNILRSSINTYQTIMEILAIELHFM